MDDGGLGFCYSRFGLKRGFYEFFNGGAVFFPVVGGLCFCLCGRSFVKRFVIFAEGALVGEGAVQVHEQARELPVAVEFGLRKFHELAENGACPDVIGAVGL